MSLLACVLLATSLFLTINHALIEQELNSQVLSNVTTGNIDANGPTSACAPMGVPKGHHGSDSCPFNFIVSLSQESLVQVQGSSSLVQLSASLVSGISTPVAVSSQGAPAGTEILFAPASARPSFSSAMTIGTSMETPLGQFNITILVAGGGFEKSAILSLLVVPIIHDMAIATAKVQGSATIGNIVLINATATNYGSVPEAFELRAYANATLVAVQSVSELAPTAIYAGQLFWNTTGYSPGVYSVLVTIPPVRGELNLLDNSREAGNVLLAQAPGSRPLPSPAASGGGQGFNYGRQLAIVAAIAEAAIVFVVVLRRKSKGSTGDASFGARKT